MKKLFYSIATLASVALLATGCLASDNDTEFATPVYSDGIDIAISDVKDSSFVATISPKSDATYYSYLVEEADEPSALDASKLFSVGYKGVEQGTVSYTKAKSFIVSLSALKPNTTYQVYAVSGSSTGIASEISVKTVKTSDGGIPTLAGFSSDSNYVKITFSEAVNYEKKQLKIKYYAYNSDEIFAGDSLGTITLPVDSVHVAEDNKSAEFLIPDLYPGAYFAVDFPEGTFTDMVGLKIPAQFSGVYCSSKDYEVYPQTKSSIHGHANNVTFKLGKGITSKKVIPSTWDSPINVSFDAKCGYGYTYSNKVGSVTFTNSVKSTKYPFTPNKNFGYDSSIDSVSVVLPAEPQAGDKIAIEILAGTFEDYYGNTNDAYSVTMNCVYGYSLNDILGAYKFSSVSGFDGVSPVTGTFSVVKSDNDKIGNVMITGFFFASAKPFYATFDKDYGTLTIPSGQLFVEGTSSDGFIFLLDDSGNPLADPLVMNVYTAHQISTSAFIGLLSGPHGGGSSAVTNYIAAFFKFVAVLK